MFFITDSQFNTIIITNIINTTVVPWKTVECNINLNYMV